MSGKNQYLEAISPDNNAVVSASAGTGKTWLLIARILRLLLHKIGPETILAVTFTEKAAAEMYQRLYAKTCLWAQLGDDELIAQLTEINVSNPWENLSVARSLYKKLLNAADNIQLMTFHAFCADLLRQFPFEANISPDFTILEDDWELKHIAYDTLCREIVKDRKQLRMMNEFTELCGGKFVNAKGALLDFLDHRNDWLALTEENTISPMQIAKQLREEMKVSDHALIFTPKSIAALAEHREVLQARGNISDLKHAETIQAIIRVPQKALDNQILEKLQTVFYRTDETQRDSDPNDRLQQTLQKLKITVDKFYYNRTVIIEEMERLHDTLLKRKNWKRNQLWYLLGQKLITIYQNLKDSRQMLDFSDLEHYASKLLNTPETEWMSYRLNRKIRHILIDEFQDTNPNQWLLVEPLLKEIVAQERYGSAFIVGDAKQSIYGFRRANPELQKEVTRWFKQHLAGKEYRLDLSRRSSPEITHYINAVFTQDEKSQKLLPDFKNHQTIVQAAGRVAIFPFFNKDAKKQTMQWRDVLRDPPAISIDEPVIDEANAVAYQIRYLLEQRTEIHTAENSRLLTYSDILILARRRKNLCRFEAALAQLKIPHVSNNSNDLYESEIQDLIALLRFLRNPYEDVALVQILRSPMFSISDEQLIFLANIDQADSWFLRLKIAAENAPGWEPIIAQLNEWLNLTDKLPLHDLLDRIYVQSDLIYRYRLSVSENERDLSTQRLLSFLNYSLNFEGGRYPAVDQLLEYLNRYMKYQHAVNNNSLINLSAGQTDGVRLMTIHQAKGLEAAAVFLVDTAAVGKSRGKTYKNIVIWDADQAKPSAFLLLPPVKEIDSSTSGHYKKLKAREDKEETNIIYVALTRARQYLYISGHGKIGRDSWYQRLKSVGQVETLTSIPPASSTDKLPLITANIKASDDTCIKKTYIVDGQKSQIPKLTVEVSPSRLHQKLPAPVVSKLLHTQVRGNIIHRALHLLNNKISKEEVCRYLRREFSHVEIRSIDEWLEQANALLKRESLRSLFDDTIYQHAFNEIRISFMQDGDQYYGIIDRLCIGRDAAWVVDYKTQVNARKRLNMLRKQYHRQMSAYAHGVANLYPQRRIRASLLFVSCGTLLDYDFNCRADS